MLKTNFGDLVAANMDVIIQSDDYKQIFQSENKTTEACERSKSPIKQAFDILIRSSEKLDNLGFEKIATDILEVINSTDLNQVSDTHNEILRELALKHPELKRPIKELVVESPLEEPIGEMGANETQADTIFEVTSPPPSIMAEELPIIPRPSSTKALLEELEKIEDGIYQDELSGKEIDNLLKDIETQEYTPHSSNEKTIKPGFPSDVYASFERLDQWILKHAETLNEDEEEFEDEDDEE